MSDSKTKGPLQQLPDTKVLELFKFYEGGSEKVKDRIWTSTTWVLTLNTAILAFAFDYFDRRAGKSGFILVELLAALVGVGLSFFLIYLLRSFGAYVEHYWKCSDELATGHPSLKHLTQAPPSRFWVLLQILAACFAIVHLGVAAFLVKT